MPRQPVPLDRASRLLNHGPTVLPAIARVAGPHDLILAEVVGAWADERVFSDGRWHFENAPDGLHSLHHVAGGFFYAVGAPITPSGLGMP